MAVLDANDKTFDEVIQGEYTVVDFYGDHCGGCIMLAPVFEEAANDMPFIRFVHINVTQNREIADRCGIRAIPTLYFYRDGEIVHTALGSMPRQELDRHIAALLYQ